MVLYAVGNRRAFNSTCIDTDTALHNIKYSATQYVPFSPQGGVPAQPFLAGSVCILTYHMEAFTLSSPLRNDVAEQCLFATPVGNPGSIPMLRCFERECYESSVSAEHNGVAPTCSACKRTLLSCPAPLLDSNVSLEVI